MGFIVRVFTSWCEVRIRFRMNDYFWVYLSSCGYWVYQVACYTCRWRQGTMRVRRWGRRSHSRLDPDVGTEHFGGGDEVTHPTRVEEKSPSTSIAATRCTNRGDPTW